MRITSSVHVHTTFCDGRNTPREMAEAACAQGLRVLGFSGHSYVPRDDFGIRPEALPGYIAEIRALQREYAGRLTILCGLETDENAPPLELRVFDYVIGSAHTVRDPAGRVYTVDSTPEEFARAIDEGFGGDALALAAAYYAQLNRYVLALRPTIVGHFDLIRKFNAGNRFFDEDGDAYRAIASQALAPLLRANLVLEVNTGAIARGWREDPYPADFLLRQIREAGGRVVITADAHAADALTCAFDDALRRVRSAGFDAVYELTAAGFVPLPLR